LPSQEAPHDQRAVTQGAGHARDQAFRAAKLRRVHLVVERAHRQARPRNHTHARLALSHPVEDAQAPTRRISNQED
jgi:hypothetical protein